MNDKYIFTSESVSEGHPDKLADQISDAILDEFLRLDPNAKVGCETFLTHKSAIVGGEVHSSVPVSDTRIEEVVRRVIGEVGYTGGDSCYDAATIPVTNHLNQQSSEIRRGVDLGGAGDQGIMFGYACDETDVLMPLPIYLAHRLVERLAHLRKDGSIPWLLPDSKSQVSVVYENGKPVGIDTVLISTQHMTQVRGGINPRPAGGVASHGHHGESYAVTNELIRKSVTEKVIRPVLEEAGFEDARKIIVNPSGSFTIGGPAADTGLTGRKIIVDTYGGSCPHGGGAFSGKDPSKVDRSGTYAMRHVAKHLVGAGLASRCTTQVSYAIGKAEPTSLYVNFHGTGKISESRAIEAVMGLFDLRPNGIIEMLDLKRPVYRKTASYGHFGRDAFAWEVLNPGFLRKLRGLLN